MLMYNFTTNLEVGYLDKKIFAVYSPIVRTGIVERYGFDPEVILLDTMKAVLDDSVEMLHEKTTLKQLDNYKDPVSRCVINRWVLNCS